MATNAAELERNTPPSFLLKAFRPFFLAASIWSVVALLVWVGMLVHGVALWSRFGPLSWHIHEMLFGFVLAAIAGFMLTAIPNWTGRPAIQGWGLAGLVVLWIIGRVVCLLSANWPAAVSIILDLAFPVALFAVALREVIAARNWRNIMLPMPIGALAIADLFMHLRTVGTALPAGLGWRLAVAAIIILISIIGGRIIPAFTRNWLTQRGATELPAPKGLADRCALATLHAGLLAWVFVPFSWPSWPIGALLVVAALCNLWRLSRWRGMATLAEPLLSVMHLGYLWLAIGAGLLGLALLTPAVPVAAAVHALTVGAIGTMVLAVMTRVSLGHTGRPLTADRTTVAIYLLVTATAIIRVVAEIIGGSAFLTLIELSGGLWAASFALFVIVYAPKLIAPRPDRVPS